MNATQIAAEIARLSALLPAAITDESDWDGDIAAVIGHLADAQRDQGEALDKVAEMTEDMEDERWDTVSYEAGRASSILASTSCNLRTAHDLAQAAQDGIAAGIANATRIAKAITGERSSRFFDVLAALPNARPAA